MINPKELRIDNLFHPGMVIEDGSLIPDSGIIHRVGSIDKFGNIQVIDPGQPAVSLKHGKIFPIALTSEWLERCGFAWDKKNEVFTIQVGNTLYLEVDEDFDCALTPKHLPCGSHYTWSANNYVHRLQNLVFALTGTELEIKHP